MKSNTLSALNLRYKIVPTPMDGNCFYHAFSYLYDIDFSSLRAKIASFVTPEDAELYSAMHDIEITTDELTHLIEYGTEWADHVEICIAMRLVRNSALYIVDDDYSVICVQGINESPTMRIIMRKHLHYTPVLIFNKDRHAYEKECKFLKDFVNGLTCRYVHTVDIRESEEGLNLISLAFGILIIVFVLLINFSIKY